MKNLLTFETFLNESAFHTALAKAKEEGLEEFEFQGNTYPVKKDALKEGTINESYIDLSENLKNALLDLRELQDRKLEIKFEKFGIGYSWTDKFGKEKYEEGSFSDAKSFDEILKRISEEILYQEENKY